MSDYPLFADRYALIRRLAVGGMGEVFLAEDRAAGGKQVAVKRILRSMAGDDNFVEMFLDEARIAGTLNHPNVVRIYDVGRADGLYYLVMEYLDGADIARLMGRAIKLGRPFGIGVALRVVRDIAAGAHYAHVKRDDAGNPLSIVHRDLTPRNTMITFDGQAKILDFGLAKAANQVNVTMTGKIKGTPSYLAPEQLDGAVQPSVDIFAMGVMLFELTTLRRLFRRSTTIDTMRAVKQCRVPRPSSLVQDYPKAVESVVLRALARRPSERYATADELREALEYALRGLDPALADVGVSQTVHELLDERTPVAPEPEPYVAQPLADLEVTALGDEPQRDPSDVFPGTPAEPPRPRVHLPEFETGFVGRESSMAALARALDKGSRLISLYGPPGTGKTRLAVEFAKARRAGFDRSGGVWFIEGEGVGSLVELCAAVAGALGVPLQAEGGTTDLVESVGRALAGRGALLIVLDAADPVIDHLAIPLRQWLSQAPEVRFLLTSRQLLRIPEETAIEVNPLPTEGADQGALSAAVDLFVDRARAAQPRWEPRRQDLKTIGRIVQRLDGIPLAIELAAARMSDTEPSRLLDQLSRRVDVLKLSGPQDTTRHSTLQAAIEWSWTRLEPWEKAALAQCSVFHGGFDMEAADAVIDLSDHPAAPWVVDVLQTLRDKSLVRSYESSDFPGEPRCRQYSSVRKFARQKLEADGLSDETMERHARYYLRMGEFWARGAGDRTGVEGRKRLAVEQPNLLALHRRLLSGRPVTVEQVTRAMEIALCLAPVVTVRGPFRSFLDLLDRTLTSPAAQQADVELRAQVLLARGHVHRVHGDLDKAREDFRTVMELARVSRSRSLAGRGMTEMAHLRLLLGQHVPAQDMLRRALTMLTDAGDVDWQGRTLVGIGRVCLMRGELEKARACFERALPRFRAVGDVVLEGACLGNLGTLRQAEGELDAAREHFEEAVALHREVGASRYEGYTLVRLGSVLHEKGELEGAAALYRDGIRVLTDVGDRRWRGVGLGYQGVLFHEVGRLASARKRLSRAFDLLAETGDTRMGTFVQGALGAVCCAQGDRATARDHIQRAERIARSVDDELLGHAVDVYRAYLEIAEALQDPDTSGAIRLRDTARDRLVRAMIRTEPGDEIIRSDLADLYRLSVRLLRQTIEAVDAGRPLAGG